MNLHKLSGWVLALAAAVLFTSNAAAYVMVTVQASNPYAFGTGAGAIGGPGIFTIARSYGATNVSVTVQLSVSGTAVAGTDYTAIPTNVTLAANVLSSNVTVTVINNTLSTAKTVVLNLLTNASYYSGLYTNAVVTLLPLSDSTNSVTSPVGRYWRGSGSDPTYWSQVVPMDYETGTVYSNLNGNAGSLYDILSWTSTNYHYNAVSPLSQNIITNRIPFNNPIVAFGERVGGTPLYLNQEYNIGIYSGEPASPIFQSPYLISAIYIQVYARTNYGYGTTPGNYAGTIMIYPPISIYTNQWTNYVTSGFQVTTSTNYNASGQITTNNFGLTTTLSSAPALSFGGNLNYGPGYVLTHTANSQATNYLYVVTETGSPDGTNLMVIGANGVASPSLLYTLEFEQRPQWRSVFLDQPHFDGSPLPPFYAGDTVAEMLTNTPPVTNVVNFSPSAATNLDNSPELRRHPILDNFVASMGNDPIALANYVINQIDLTDPMDYSDDGNIAEQSISPGGVSRGALGTFLEKQGSPVEECALLVYLLRQAGVPAVYEFPPRNGMKILDARLSQMLKFQVQGGYSEAGQLYTTNTMITVNYPWVAAYIGTNWVHIFPWLKDYEMNEGLNLWEEMPTNYSDAYGVVHDYIYGKTNLLSLASDGDNTLRVIFPKFIQQTLLTNHPGVSLDDIGMQIINRQHYYSRWQDFPTPTWVTNVSTSLENLTSSAITNISPTLTNIFDTVSVEIYSITNPAEDIQTGDLRLCDLHNREFYINQVTNGSGGVQLSLILLPFRPSITNQLAFGNDTNLLSKELLSLTLGASDDELGVRFRYHRHRALSSAYAIDPNTGFLGFQAVEEIDFERPLRKGDQAAICLDYGRVTTQMLNVHAADLWQMESELSTNSALTNSISPDVYQGATMYLAGMSYYEKVSEFAQLNQRLQKMDTLSFWAAGLSKLSPARDGSGNLLNGKIDPILPCVDMFFYETANEGNDTMRPDSGQPHEIAAQNFNLIGTVDASAEEHQVINRFYQQTNAVSTVRLLQLAGTNIVPLNIDNYTTQGQVTYQGQQLQNWDSSLWSSVASAFQNSSVSVTPSFVSAYMTPGPETNSAYKGMGALILGWKAWQALITPSSLNGGFGQNLPSQTVEPVNLNNFNLFDFNGDLSMSLNASASGATLALIDVASPDFLTTYNGISSGSDILDSYDTLWSGDANSEYGLTTSGSLNTVDATAFQFAQQSGDVGKPDDSGSTFWSTVLDPVHSVTGEFYADATDIQLPGPMPLTLSRHYSSQNLADNQFGAGWKLNLMPYLCVSTGGTNIFAADMDGAVLAYVQTATNANVWLPTLAANPQLNNDSTAGVGSVFNRLRNRVVLTGTTNYTLYAADGSVRTFQTMTFNNGVLNQTRPYLQQWADSRGNYYTFTYETDLTQSNFGQVTRIQSSNGNFLGFDYDIYNHIIDAYTGDGRWLYYDYDEYGDLITVTLPDNTTRSYQYLLGTQAVTNGSAFYSTHLIIEEDKPDGRALINAYDSQRRVTNQWSTAGADLNPIRTGTFIYSNNFNITNSFTNAISGYTLIIDGNGNTNRYDYTNSLITKITDPLSQTIQQTWYADNATTPGYPRSLATRTDKRGLLTQYEYDSNGDVTNTVVTGDLTGDGITSQTATNTTIYNNNCLPIQVTDAADNSVVTTYDPTYHFLPSQVIHYTGGTPVSTNYMIYGSASTVITNGSTIQTNVAYGLMTRQIRAYSSPDSATNDMLYNGNGFLTESIRYSGTGDPNVTNYYFYNERGDPVVQMDVLGAETFSAYDAMDRPIEKENIDEFGNPLAWSFYYYDDNGEINWIDGPRYNPEDYIFYDYDGAGRVTTKIQWLSTVNSNSTGMTAPSGYNVYAQTFYQYDPMGNLIFSVDPRGAMITNSYDALCRLVQKKYYSFDGVSFLSTEGYGYEPGGQVKYYTNALGGITTKLYTTVGKPEFQSNPDGSTNAWRYLLDGRINKEIQSNGAYWQTTYDDVNRITTRIFYSAAGVPEATNSVQLDRRGNTIQKVDAEGNIFTTSYDGLDRAKITVGPSIYTVEQTGTPPNLTTVTNISQQAVTNYYDAAGRVITNMDALGEVTVTTSDSISRPVSKLIYNTTGTLARETYWGYTPDHNGVITTNGSGPTAIVNTSYTDTENNPAISIGYPSAGILDINYKLYDLAGKVYWIENATSSNGIFIGNFATEYFYDAMLRPANKYDRDNAETDYYPDAMGNVTNRTMPATGFQWLATYNNAGKMLQEKYVNGSTATRTNAYTYYSSGNPFAGLLQTKTDGRGVSCTYYYDDWLRTTNMIYSGPLPEDDLTTTWQYDPRGYVVDMTEAFANTNTAPATSIQRSYDAYGQLSSESVSGGSFSYSDNQGWDVTGRRTSLGIGNGNDYGSYIFSWQADGNLDSASCQNGTGIYTYDTAGILTERTAGSRATTITSRDGEGRPLSIATTVNSSSELTESLVWAPEGLITTDTLARADFTDSRSYSYAALSRRLTNEVLNINGSTRWTNNMTYDNGVAAELGTLTQLGPTNNWNGVEDAFSRVNTETNTAISYPAYGHINGQSTLFGWLDNNPISITSDGTNAMQWRASMELTPGAHQLKVAALHPSGFYTAWATNSFTNKLAYQATADTFDSAGNITQRIWKNPNGTTNLIQTLSWDARGRLHGVTNRDMSNSGYNWSTIYDPLNRRIQTTTVLVSNGIPYTVPPTVINSYYDPQVEFLELGVQYGISQEWKLYGPDSNGKYGGLNGTGGFDGVSPGLDLFYPTIADERGDILAQITNGVVAWNAARPTGYGAVPSYRPVALGNGADVVQSSAWRGRWVDITGYYEIGLRPYNPISGSWLTYDSISDERNPNCYTFAGGDPINYFDADGRIGKDLYATSTFGASSFLLNQVGSQLNSYADSSANSVLAPVASFSGSLFNEVGAMNNPSTYVNGLYSFGNNINTVYQSGGVVDASSYALTSWNMGAVMSGFADQDQVTGQSLGGGLNQATTIFQGIAGTASVAAGGLGLYNLATAPTTASLDGVSQYSEPIGPQNIASDSGTITVIGSRVDVAPYVGVPNYNTFTGEGITAGNGGTLQQNLDSANASWLNDAIQNGDTIMKVTDPDAYAQTLSEAPNKPQSAYLNLELPMVNEYEGVNAVPNYATSPGTSGASTSATPGN